MGISDRDYMRKPERPVQAPKPRARIHKADNRPSLWARLRFLLWSLTHRS